MLNDSMFKSSQGVYQLDSSSPLCYGFQDETFNRNMRKMLGNDAELAPSYKPQVDRKISQHIPQNPSLTQRQSSEAQQLISTHHRASSDKDKFSDSFGCDFINGKDCFSDFQDFDQSPLERDRKLSNNTVEQGGLQSAHSSNLFIQDNKSKQGQSQSSNIQEILDFMITTQPSSSLNNQPPLTQVNPQKNHEHAKHSHFNPFKGLSDLNSEIHVQFGDKSIIDSISSSAEKPSFSLQTPYFDKRRDRIKSKFELEEEKGKVNVIPIDDPQYQRELYMKQNMKSFAQYNQALKHEQIKGGSTFGKVYDKKTGKFINKIHNDAEVQKLIQKCKFNLKHGNIFAKMEAEIYLLNLQDILKKRKSTISNNLIRVESLSQNHQTKLGQFGNNKEYAEDALKFFPYKPQPKSVVSVNIDEQRSIISVNKYNNHFKQTSEADALSVNSLKQSNPARTASQICQPPQIQKQSLIQQPMLCANDVYILEDNEEFVKSFQKQQQDAGKVWINNPIQRNKENIVPLKRKYIKLSSEEDDDEDDDLFGKLVKQKQQALNQKQLESLMNKQQKFNELDNLISSMQIQKPENSVQQDNEQSLSAKDSMVEMTNNSCTKKRDQKMDDKIEQNEAKQLKNHTVEIVQNITQKSITQESQGDFDIDIHLSEEDEIFPSFNNEQPQQVSQQILESEFASQIEQQYPFPIEELAPKQLDDFHSEHSLMIIEEPIKNESPCTDSSSNQKNDVIEIESETDSILMVESSDRFYEKPLKQRLLQVFNKESPSKRGRPRKNNPIISNKPSCRKSRESNQIPIDPIQQKQTLEHFYQYPIIKEREKSYDKSKSSSIIAPKLNLIQQVAASQITQPVISNKSTLIQIRTPQITSKRTNPNKMVKQPLTQIKSQEKEPRSISNGNIQQEHTRFKAQQNEVQFITRRQSARRSSYNHSQTKDKQISTVKSDFTMKSELSLNQNQSPLKDMPKKEIKQLARKDFNPEMQKRLEKLQECIMEKFRDITSKIQFFKFRMNIKRADLQLLMKSFIMKQQPFNTLIENIILDSNYRYIIEAVFDFKNFKCRIRSLDRYQADDQCDLTALNVSTLSSLKVSPIKDMNQPQVDIQHQVNAQLANYELQLVSQVMETQQCHKDENKPFKVQEEEFKVVDTPLRQSPRRQSKSPVNIQSETKLTIQPVSTDLSDSAHLQIERSSQNSSHLTPSTLTKINVDDVEEIKQQQPIKMYPLLQQERIEINLIDEDDSPLPKQNNLRVSETLTSRYHEKDQPYHYKHRENQQKCTQADSGYTIQTRSRSRSNQNRQPLIPKQKCPLITQDKPSLLISMVPVKENQQQVLFSVQKQHLLEKKKLIP
eukprot:403342626